MAVIGEPFKEVSPGFLPRTLDQLRAGRPNDATLPQNRSRRERLPEEEGREEWPQQSFESALDELLDEASDDKPDRSIQTSANRERLSAQPPAHTEASNPTRPSTSTEIHLQRARDRFVRVFGTREEVQQDDYVSPLANMYGRAYDRYRQAEDRRASGETAAPSLDNVSAQERREIEQQILWGVMQDSRPSTLGDETSNVRSYTLRDPSPARASDIGATPSDSVTGARADLVRITNDFARLRSLSPARRTPISDMPSTNAPPSGSMTSTSPAPPPSRADIRPALEQIGYELARLRQASGILASHRHRTPSPPPTTLDSQPDRPAPMTDEQMTKKVACQVCYQQLADIAVLPCGHMVMCEWCADVVVPTKGSSSGTGHLPVGVRRCPMCRKQVRQRFKIHF